ncbi:hypothetical protein Egran_03651 [Elaphomyces granulatus]|uniref:Uncharacterized protein n=1 Tax=Elaphomyces granulatus TaxID=519963 RepID=A0A232LWP7_9EURO|nr:hypothetical protein Egran_03651 [Elaphomyces granulatus]
MPYKQHHDAVTERWRRYYSIEGRALQSVPASGGYGHEKGGADAARGLISKLKEEMMVMPYTVIKGSPPSKKRVGSSADYLTVRPSGSDISNYVEDGTECHKKHRWLDAVLSVSDFIHVRSLGRSGYGDVAYTTPT